MGGLNAGSRAPRVTAPKKRGKPNHRGKRQVTDKTALEAMKLERQRLEVERYMNQPHIVSRVALAKVMIGMVNEAIARRAARKADEAAVPQTEKGV